MIAKTVAVLALVKPNTLRPTALFANIKGKNSTHAGYLLMKNGSTAGDSIHIQQ